MDTERLTFAEVTALTPDGPGRFGAVASPEWTIGGKPNGGYLLAMLGRAAAAVSEHPHVITASACYLRPPEPGPVAIEAQVLRAGRSASQVRARLTQDGRDCVEALITTSTLQPGGKPHWDAGLPTPSQVSYEECPRLVPRLPTGLPVAIMSQIQVRLEPATSGFTRGQPDGHGELRGWLTLPADETFGPESLLFAVDAYPPATFDIEFTGWVPTLELTVYVRALPVPGPVRVLQRAQLIDGQRVDETCYIWDSAGRLVAQGSQLAAIRLG
ncbi:MAG TPA: thioesterase family protein [Streptosporangiaceae bacterium]|jgi:acyl-CoA thioesterase